MLLLKEMHRSKKSYNPTISSSEATNAKSSSFNSSSSSDHGSSGANVIESVGSCTIYLDKRSNPSCITVVSLTLLSFD